MLRVLFVSFLSLGLVLRASAVEDEPDELNWDSLGGTVTGFNHFAAYCAEHADFRSAVLQAAPLEALPAKVETIWITPDAFTNAVFSTWSLGTVNGERCLYAPAGHCVGPVRIGVDIPVAGCYRVWAKYWHDANSVASFSLALEDGRLATEKDSSVSVVQDAFNYVYDFKEFARRKNPLPSRQNEPTGFLWESSPTVRLSAGRKALTLSGLIHEGPYAPRRVTAIVLTREPVAVPMCPSGTGAIRVGRAPMRLASSQVRDLWARRPRIADGTDALKPLWRTWRQAFFADLRAGRCPGVEAGRMAGTVYFDEESNLVGTPQQVADEKERRRELVKKVRVPPGTKSLEVWRPRDPWMGHSRDQRPSVDDAKSLAPLTLALRDGEAETVLLLVRNNTAHARTLVPQIRGDVDRLVTWRVPGLVLVNDKNEWQPMPLFARDEVIVPPQETVGLWFTIAGRTGFSPRSFVVDVGTESLSVTVAKVPDYGSEVPVPYVFGWAAPDQTVSCWELFKRLGVNVISNRLVPKSEAARYGVRQVLHLNDGDVRPEHIRHLKARFARLGYERNDWAWSFMDEPGNRTVDAWTNLATRVKAFDPSIRIWVNPGEAESAGPEACLKMTPFVDAYCPYCNHFLTDGWRNASYKAHLDRKGPAFDILLGYTTPCFAEKAPKAPHDMLWLSDFALNYKLDGWAFFALMHGFTYSNSRWDEVNCFMGDQCVSIYPGAANRAISSRTAEAIHEAVRRWRAARARQILKDRKGT